MCKTVIDQKYATGPIRTPTQGWLYYLKIHTRREKVAQLGRRNIAL
jgi:hypothetical protein